MHLAAASSTPGQAGLGFDDRPAVLHSGERRALLESTAAELGWGADTFNAVELQAAVDRCRLVPDVQAQEAEPLLQTSYRCVLADEAQDLTETQWAFVEPLAAEHRHLMVVGDPAQCPSYRPVHLADEEPPFTFTWLVEQMHA